MMLLKSLTYFQQNEHLVPVCAQCADDKCDEEFMPELGSADKVMCLNDDRDKVTEDEDQDDPVTLPHHNSLSEAVTCLGDICDFLKSRGYTKDENDFNALLNCLAKNHISNKADM